MFKHILIITFIVGWVVTASYNWKPSGTYKRALQPAHEKSYPDKWMDKFHGRNYQPEKRISMVNLIFMVTKRYLSQCVPIILFDQVMHKANPTLFKQLFKDFPGNFPRPNKIPLNHENGYMYINTNPNKNNLKTYVRNFTDRSFLHGEITNSSTVVNNEILNTLPKHCQSFIVFIPDVMDIRKIIRNQQSAYVLVISWSSQWRIHEFLSSPTSHSFVNLLIVGESFKNALRLEDTYLLYTHNLFTDGLGSSTPNVLTSWQANKLVQPQVNLYPPKVSKGFAGHRFAVALAHQPPFVVKQTLRNIDGSNIRTHWDGLEVRLVDIISKMLNFTVEFKEVTNLTLGPGDATLSIVKLGKADVGIAGVYSTSDRIEKMDITVGHSQDCATFITLASTALPKYRAIMGPFQWTVWAMLTFTYLFGILPLTFSDKHSLRHLIDHPGDIENMFWYVFGTFTNCFTFVGERSWSKSKKLTTRLLVGWYWAFTIIITACYTGSIIAFVTLPAFPETVDTIDQLLEDRYRVVTLDRGGWEFWYQNVTEKKVVKLLKKMKYVPDVASGLHNVTHSFFWKYTFLGSRALLDYVTKTNFTRALGRRAVFHIADQCFVPYSVSMILPRDSIYKQAINRIILQSIQAGIVHKQMNDVKWNFFRSKTGQLLQINQGSELKLPPPEERALTLDDTQGMFLLLAAGFILGLASLVSEYVGGCVNYFKEKQFLKRGRNSMVSTIRSFHAPTPNPPEAQQTLPNFMVTEPLSSDNSVDGESVSEVEGQVMVHRLENHIAEGNGSTISSNEIDRIFDLDYLFGEEQHPDEDVFENDEEISITNTDNKVEATKNTVTQE